MFDTFFSIEFPEVIGDGLSDQTNPSSPSLLFAESSAEGGKRTHHTSGSALAVDRSQAIEHHETTYFKESLSCGAPRLKTYRLYCKPGDMATQQHATKHLLLCRVHLALVSRKGAAASLMFLHEVSVRGLAVITDRGGARLLLHSKFLAPVFKKHQECL